VRRRLLLRVRRRLLRVRRRLLLRGRVVALSIAPHHAFDEFCLQVENAIVDAAQRALARRVVQVAVEAHYGAGLEHLADELVCLYFFEQTHVHLAAHPGACRHSGVASAVFFAAVCAGFLMRVICTDGRFFEYDYPDDVRLDAALIEQTLAFHAKPDGCIDHLCLDFSGSYVPIAQ